MHTLQSASLTCPYCWETIEIVVDDSVPDQEYIEDCSVCCRPIVITATVTPDGLVAVEGRTGDD